MRLLKAVLDKSKPFINKAKSGIKTGMKWVGEHSEELGKILNTAADLSSKAAIAAGKPHIAAGIRAAQLGLGLVTKATKADSKAHKFGKELKKGSAQGLIDSTDEGSKWNQFAKSMKRKTYGKPIMKGIQTVSVSNYDSLNRW